MAFDYKKEYKEFYMPKNKPEIVDIPPMNFIAVRGKGDPNEEDGEYKAAMGLLYGIAFTIKMSYKGNHKIEGYFDYVVPPLEGFWWQEGVTGIDYSRKDTFQWISLIRLPDFVTKADFDWAVQEASRKKQADFSKVEFFTYTEGFCVQCMHIGPYDSEPETIRLMEQYAKEQGYDVDISDRRYHHEIYLSDARRCHPDRLRTVIRHPVRRRDGEDFFLDTGFLKQEEIYLRLEKTVPGNPEKGWVPAYHFHICLLDGTVSGACDLRIGHNENLYYGGNIGYRIEEPYRGSHYAAKACQLLFELAKKHHMSYVLITCDPDNIASYKTCEYAGGVLEAVVDLPEYNDMYLSGERQKCIFRFDLL